MRVMKVILGISGASGAIYGTRLLEELHNAGVHVELVITENGKDVLRIETSLELEELETKAQVSYSDDDLFASPASGSYLFDAMVICPCSLSTLSKIANGISNSLITRAAAVCLKECRTLILVPRETPLSSIHLRNMLRLAESGSIILPPSPAFYHSPETLDDLVDFVVGKILDLLDVQHELFDRWGSGQP